MILCRSLAVLLSVLCLLPACGDEGDGQPAAGGYRATIRWTSHGVPHIRADTLGSVAFGQGYAFARDNACYLADQIVKVRSERAKYLGPGELEAHVKSDFGYKALRVLHYAEQAYPELAADVRAVLDGYAAGYNHRLAEVGPGGLPAECRDQPWVQPVTAVDLLAYYHDLTLLASGRPLKDYLAHTIKPDDGARLDHETLPRWLRPFGQAFDQGRGMVALRTQVPDFRHQDIGSNGWGLGADKTATGKGMLVGNPHFPWYGELKLWESHLTVPGQLDVAGATLYGVPLVLIGFNADLAFTNTVSASRKFTVYRLKLQPGDPTTYLVDGQPRKMQERQETIEVRQADGTLQPVTRTFYRTHFGPVATIGGVAEWTTEHAYALRDANEGNGKILEHFLAVDRARSVAELDEAVATVQANPWTNMMAADRFGDTFYTESNSTPNVSAQAVADHAKAIADGDFLTDLANQQGMVLLDGSKSSHDWVEEPGSRAPGLVPFAKTPHLQRRDFVLNANDSHWLTNPAAPLEGYGFMYGPEKTARSARTRLNLKMATEATADGAAGADGKFSLAELQALVFNGRAMVPETYLQDLVARCPGAPVEITVDGKPQAVDPGPACQVLAAWDGRYRIDSRGAVLFREWFAHAPAKLYAQAFDLQKPLETPHTLAPPPPQGADPMRVALAKAMVLLQKAGLPLDAKLGDVQYTLKGGTRIGVPGGYHGEGAFNVVGWANNDATLLPKMPSAAKVGSTSLTKDGYPINYGSSFVMVMAFGDDGPQAHALLTYSESSDAASPHFADQTQLFAQAKWRPMLFRDADIAQDPALVEQTVSAK